MHIQTEKIKVLVDGEVIEMTPEQFKTLQEERQAEKDEAVKSRKETYVARIAERNGIKDAAEITEELAVETRKRQK